MYNVCMCVCYAMTVYIQLSVYSDYKYVRMLIIYCKIFKGENFHVYIGKRLFAVRLTVAWLLTYIVCYNR